MASLMYDEDGNRRRLFSASSIGGVSSCGSVSSQARTSSAPKSEHGIRLQCFCVHTATADTAVHS